MAFFIFSARSDMVIFSELNMRPRKRMMKPKRDFFVCKTMPYLHARRYMAKEKEAEEDMGEHLDKMKKKSSTHLEMEGIGNQRRRRSKKAFDGLSHIVAGRFGVPIWSAWSRHIPLMDRRGQVGDDPSCELECERRPSHHLPSPWGILDHLRSWLFWPVERLLI